MRSIRGIRAVAAVVAGLGVMIDAAYAQEKAAGEKLFKGQCMTCHSTGRGEPHRQGPNLFGIVGRDAGRTPGYTYSDAFQKALGGKRWTDAALDAWLADTQDVAPGSVMPYVQADADKRRELIKYLNTLH
ncbi:MAG TPA: c-type cytochrome [Paucimonas sp.]|nr:c-type cytochrome [Paucimonas sp.]